MDRTTTLRLLDDAWANIRTLTAAFEAGEMPTDLFADCTEADDAYGRLNALATLVALCNNDDEDSMVCEVYEPALIAACDWPFDEE